MLYSSTRGQADPVSSAMAIKLGLAPDGGLFLPEKIPVVTKDDLKSWRDLPYAELSARVVGLYLTDYTGAELLEQTRAAYGPDRFDAPAVAPMVKAAPGVHVLELWHGPTAAFKDLALQLMPRLMTAAMAKTGERGEIAILVATSGDTGKAALEGFRDVPGTRIVVFYPAQGVSRVQELQMVTQEGANTAVIAVAGNFDDAQTGVKKIFTDPGMAAALAANGLRFSSANSINWGRLVPQIAYYIWAYLRLAAGGEIAWGAPINAAVPTGNFGNILAAYYARAMGLPIARLICASNRNKVLTDFIKTGVYDRRRDFHTTVSPSMDILISSNLERLLLLLAGRDAGRVRGWMRELGEAGHYRMDGRALAGLQEVFYGGFADEAATHAAIAHAWHDLGYLMDTHTAVGLHVLEEYRRATGDTTPAVLASTASPFKFNGAVLKAIEGEEALKGKDELKLLEELAGATGQEIPGGLRDLDKKPVRHERACKPEGMAGQVKEILGIG